MSRKTSSLSAALTLPSIVVGSIVIGCAVVDDTLMILPVLVGAAILSAIAAFVYLTQTRAKAAEKETAALLVWQHANAERRNLLLQDPATAQNAVVGSDHGGQSQDAVTAASLVTVLDHSKAMTEHEWDEVCEAIVRAIAKTGDVRCLPALDRVRLARGSEFRDTVDAAIAAITRSQHCEHRMEYGAMS